MIKKEERTEEGRVSKGDFISKKGKLLATLTSKGTDTEEDMFLEGFRSSHLFGLGV